ncbi:hypothetical protein BJV85_000118 [Clostridium acetobutylicum]|uniref:Uncharacterized protein n=1 Tax=Clostridium acetobutylicum (strain ATCC 824 / DSM 792 / JCM 1419 / IAM 19013 / LMG 5710 / NBRC 13948 / NRRL B-527 / VKM B-1787 / 2291 / W) TaxID=272562 RepID=Q97MZ6_CLOAB|nr:MULTISPECIES: hypothetical protein [Clostridium]AAK78030.1 Hypothetical protein, CF-3 family [Clostridium acetobutylicum ATCC 824]ADZ19086.1 conserved hypothetical protein [Clostridium acetobutylicum EA 2018]AEI31026.1 hypothetical protein SMB_G0043 [Clostridium acetobutylicum DSM 1731]AWV81907.1 hypothetical protein DK921_17840 [Clostridium acetobutylicum]MBC2395457.1 hypothetical protein [Clostridium acetobutylicum]
MKKEVRYLEERPIFLIRFILITIFTLAFIIGFTFMSVEGIIEPRPNGHPIVLESVVIISMVIIWPAINIFSSCKYDIILRKDELEYTGWINKRIIKYEEIKSIKSTDVDIWSPYGKGYDEIRQFVQIKLKRGRQIKILLNPNKEKIDKFHMDLMNFTGKDIKFQNKFILFVRG